MSRQIFDNSTELGINQTTVKLRSLPEKRAAAVRAVCGLAKDATEAAEVLEALGLDPAEGKSAARRVTDGPPSPRLEETA